jgi:hypothetical protein
MLRASFLVFIAGWVVWFLLDKSGVALPGKADSLLQNFQLGFDMLRAGYPGAAFLFLWQAHFLVLSLLGGILLAMLAGALIDSAGRRRLRNLMFPRRSQGGRQSREEPRVTAGDEIKLEQPDRASE